MSKRPKLWSDLLHLGSGTTVRTSKATSAPALISSHGIVGAVKSGVLEIQADPAEGNDEVKEESVCEDLDVVMTDPNTSRPNIVSHTSRFSGPERLRPLFFLGTLGLRVLFEPRNNTETVADIVLLHGLTGDSFNTWFHEKSGTYWPIDVLSPTVPDARILAFGYDADVTKLIGAVSTNNFREHAMDLLNDLATVRMRDKSGDRPIIFLAHSLGGLVLKKVLCLSESSYETHLKQVDNCTVAIGFLGTPHRGSGLAEFADALAKVLKIGGKRVNRDILGVLKRKSEILADVEDGFAIWLRRKGASVDISCFHEQLELPGIGLVVSKQSAKLSGYPSLSIHANHMNMTRFKSKDDQGFIRVSGELDRWLHALRSDDEGAQERRQAQEERTQAQEECLRSLHFPDLGLRQETLEPALSHTFDWAWSDPANGFTDWAHDGVGLFWIQGKPGSGKSTFVKYLAEKIHKTSSIDGDSGKDDTQCSIVVASHFFEYSGSAVSRSVEGLLRSLIWQILRQSGQAFSGIMPLFQEIKRIRSALVWRLYDLESALANILSILNNRVFLFVDALDEFEGLDIDIAAFCFKLCKSAPPNLRLCVSSRRLPDFQYHFRDCKGLTMENHTAADIQHYTTSALGGIAAEGHSSYAKLIENIKGKANGMFLWVRLVTDEVSRGWRRAEELGRLQERINSMPQSLFALYKRILDNMDSADRSDTHTILAITTSATRALSLTEFRYVLEHLTDPPCSLQQPIERRIQALCAGLVEIRNGYVHFTHETVLSFVQKGALAGGSGAMDATVSEGHASLLKACLRRLLCIKGFDSTTGVFRIENEFGGHRARFLDGPELSFSEYAVLYWTLHARSCLKRPPELHAECDPPEVSIPHRLRHTRRPLNADAATDAKAHWMSNGQYLLWRELFLGSDARIQDGSLAHENIASAKLLLELVLLGNIGSSACFPDDERAPNFLGPEAIDKLSIHTQWQPELKSAVRLNIGPQSILCLTATIKTKESQLQASQRYFVYTVDALLGEDPEKLLGNSTSLVHLHLTYGSDHTLPWAELSPEQVAVPGFHPGFWGLKINKPLAFPCTDDEFEELQILTTHNASLNGPNMFQDPGNLTQYAAFHTMPRILERLLLNGASVDFLCEGSDYGTPLLAAIYSLSHGLQKGRQGISTGLIPQVKLVELLLQRGADPNLVARGTKIGLKTPLEGAVRIFLECALRVGFGLSALKAVILLLLNWGANPDRITRAIGSRDYRIRTLFRGKGVTEERTLSEASLDILKALEQPAHERPSSIGNSFGHTPATVIGAIRGVHTAGRFSVPNYGGAQTTGIHWKLRANLTEVNGQDNTRIGRGPRRHQLGPGAR